MGTPISEAYSRYRKLRRKGRRRMTREEQVWYFTYRHFRNYTKEWKRSRKSQLINHIENDLEHQRNRLVEWREFEEWAESRTFSSSSNQSRWEKHFLTRIRADVDFLENAVEDFSDDDNVLETVIDLVAAAGSELGLVVDEDMTDEEDGCVWFVDEATGKHYFWALGLNCDGINVTESIAVSPRAKSDDRWRAFNGISLNQFALEQIRPSNVCGSSYHPARVFNDYFGLYNSLGVREGELTDSVERALSSLSRIKRS